jgi:hypothetical protein
LKLLDENTGDLLHRAKLNKFGYHFVSGMVTLVRGKNILAKVMDRFIRFLGASRNGVAMKSR